MEGSRNFRQGCVWMGGVQAQMTKHYDNVSMCVCVCVCVCVFSPQHFTEVMLSNCLFQNELEFYRRSNLFQGVGTLVLIPVKTLIIQGV